MDLTRPQEELSMELPVSRRSSRVTSLQENSQSSADDLTSQHSQHSQQPHTSHAQYRVHYPTIHHFQLQQPPHKQKHLHQHQHQQQQQQQQQQQEHLEDNQHQAACMHHQVTIEHHPHQQPHQQHLQQHQIQQQQLQQQAHQQAQQQGWKCEASTVIMDASSRGTSKPTCSKTVLGSSSSSSSASNSSAATPNQRKPPTSKSFNINFL